MSNIYGVVKSYLGVGVRSDRGDRRVDKRWYIFVVVGVFVRV